MPAFELVAAVAGFLGLTGILCLVLGVRALRHRRPLRFTIDTLAGLLLIVTGLLLATLGVATQGYQALTREVVAARVTVRPTGSQQFDAEFHFPDTRQVRFALAGDHLYVDAHILKWKPLANVFGLHTAYELDRVAGRYASLEQERAGARTIFALAQDKLLNIFHLRQRYALLAPLVDVEYGSATFAPVTRPASFEIRVSTSGLLIREVPASP